MRINLNKVAVEVAKKEGGKKSISIGQIKECQKLTFEELINNYSEADILKMLERYLG